MIVIVITSLGRGGAERSTLQLVDGLISKNVEVRLVVLFREVDEYPIPDKLSPVIYWLESPSYIVAVIRLYKTLICLRPRFVYSVMPQANIGALLCTLFLNIPLISSERTTIELFYRSKAKKALVLLGHLLASRAVFISYFALSNGLSGSFIGRAITKKAHVLHNPVFSPMNVSESLARRKQRIQRLEAFVGSSTHTQGGKKEAVLRIVLASRLVRGKGLIEFLFAARYFIRDHDVVIIVAGAGDLKDDILRTCAELGVESKVSLRGFVEDIWQLYAEADVVVLCSESEGFGRVGFEAYLAGCLVIGTKENSFVDEVIPESPAWTIVSSFDHIDAALERFVERSPKLACADDLHKMRAALSVDAHVSKFLSILGACQL